MALMTKQAILIDSAQSNRAALSHQLAVAGSYRVLQFPTLAEALRGMNPSSMGKGLVFLALSEGVGPLSEFMRFLRKNNPEACVIVTASSITFEEARLLIQMGIDQIILSPFNVNQLKMKILAAETFRSQILEEESMKPSTVYFKKRVESLTDKFYKVSLSGWLAENCELPDIKPDLREATLFIECDHMHGINSIGIRLWMMWLKTLKVNGFFRFEFENLRTPLLHQASVTHGFIPENGSVNSFYLYYWNEELNLEKEFKISRGKEFGIGQMKIPKYQQDVTNGISVNYELDISTIKHLRFYSGVIEII